jgi:hypothetical protein
MLDINGKIAKINESSILTGLAMVKVSDLVNVVDTLRAGNIEMARVALEQQLDIVSKVWRKEAKFK